MTRQPLSSLSIVILNWNSSEDTLALLGSIKRQTYEGKIEIWVVDNGSTDGSVAKINKNFPETKIISLPQNAGIWARNFAFKKLSGEVVVTLDSDAYLTKNDVLKRLVQKLLLDPQIGIIGPKIISKRAGGFSALHLNFFTGTAYRGDPDQESAKVTWVPFICAAFTRQTLKKVGMTYRAFAYGEDLNFCLRIKNAGLKVLYWPQISVIHYKRKTTADVPFEQKYYHYYKSIFRNIYGYGNFFQKISVTVFQLLIIPLFMVATGNFHLVQPKQRIWGFWWNAKHLSRETKTITGIFIAAIFLRILFLGKNSVWYDEAFTYHIAKLPLSDLFFAVLSDNNPPLYYLLMHFVLKVGKNDLLLRIPSLVFNLATILMIYFGLKKYFSKKTCLIAAALFTFSPLAIYLSSEARLHSLAVFFVPAIILAFLNFISVPTKTTVSIFMAVTLLGLYSHYYIFLLLIPLTFLAIRSKLPPIEWLLVLAGFTAAFSPWAFFSSLIHHNGCACPNTILSLPATLVSPSIGGVGNITLRTYPDLAQPVSFFFALTALITTTIFIKGLLKNFQLTTLYLSPLLAVSILGLFLPVFSPKAFTVFVPIYFLITAQSIARMKNADSILRLLIGVFSAVLLIQLTNPFFRGTDFKSISEVIRRKPASVLHSSVFSFYSLSYYLPAHKHYLITSNPLVSETIYNIGGRKYNVKNLYDSEFWLIDTQIWVDKKEYEAVRQTINSFSVEKILQTNGVDINYIKI